MASSFGIDRVGMALIAATTLATFSGTSAPGATYTIRVTTAYGIAGAPASRAAKLLYAQATSNGRWARFDILAMEPALPNLSPRSYVLASDSGDAVLVDSDSSQYRDASSITGIGRLSALLPQNSGVGTMAKAIPGVPLGPEATAPSAPTQSGLRFGVVVRDVKIDVKKLDTLEQIGLFNAEHYVVTADYVVSLSGRPVALHATTDVWTVPASSKIINPFDQLSVDRRELSDAAGELEIRLRGARKAIMGVPIRSRSILSLAPPSSQGVPADRPAVPGVEIVQMVEVSPIQQVEVDPEALRLPPGFKKM